MKRENLAFLIAGFLYGSLFGFGIVYIIEHRPAVGATQAAPGSAEITSPSGPMAPTQTGGVSGAPMMAEITALKQRVGEDPRDIAALTRLANLYHDAGMWQQAVDYYQSALEVTPEDPDLLTDMGICYQQLQRYEEALDLFDRAQGVDSSHWESLYNTAIVAGLYLGKIDRAEAALNRLEQLRPSAPRLDELRQTVERARLARRGEDSR